MVMIDNLIIDQIEQQTIDKNVAVLLSGGVDSLSVAFAAHRMGKKDNCIYVSSTRPTII